MAVYDRWHVAPAPGSRPCEHRDRARGQLYPSSTHGAGRRWQVRWRDETGRQQKRNFDKKTGADPDTCADAFDAKITAELNAGTYIDPAAGEIAFRAFAEEVVENRVLDPATREKMRGRLERHVYPVVGEMTLKALARRPSLIQNLVRALERKPLAPSHIQVVMAHVTTVFSAAAEDGLVLRNPCRSTAVVLPKVVKKDLVPWTAENVQAMRAALPPRYAAMVDAGAGLGMRQGEILAFSPEDVDWLRGKAMIRRQIKRVGGKLVFALPKGEKVREVPLPKSVKLALSEHMRGFPSATVTLPWRVPDGEPHTARLLFTSSAATAIHATRLNIYWRSALESAGIVPAPEKGGRRVPAREHGMHALRHFFASALITEGESIKAVSEWLGHASIQITLDLYTHLMPRSEVRMRKIIDGALTSEDGASALKVPSGARGSGSAAGRGPGV